MGEQIILTCRAERGCAVITLGGELDLLAVRAWRDRLLALCPFDGAPVVLDLSRLQFCDLSGVRLLRHANDRACAAGGRLALAAPPPIPAKVLRLTGLDEALTITADLDTAITAITLANTA